MKTNVANKAKVYTAEGAVASNINAAQALRRSVMACMLWEDIHYEDGQSVAERIKALVPKVKPEVVAMLAVEARENMKLRHVPLLLVREMARLPEHRPLVAKTLARVIQRADELSEFLSIYWTGNKDQPLAAQVKKGLAAAFQKFDAYQLAKYDRAGAIRLRDALFLCHPKPNDDAQQALWNQLVEGTLPTPDTWEVALSAGKDKKEAWTQLLSEGKLGALALLRNLRNMTEVSVKESIIREGLAKMKTERVLPFRFVTAASYAPQLEDALETAMFSCLKQQARLPGVTVLMVDISGSMFAAGNVSKHSELKRVDAAAALAMLVREICDQPIIYATAGDDGARVHATKRVPPRRGFGLRDAILRDMRTELGGGGIFLAQCLEHAKHDLKGLKPDRLIVLTDEQDCDHKLNPATADAFAKHNYIVNVSVEEHGIGYGKFTKIDGWSEAVLDYIAESEKAAQV